MKPNKLTFKTPNHKPQIILIGGGGHCRSVIDVIEQENRFKIAGIIDKKELIGHEILGYKVIGSDDDLKDLRKDFEYAIVTVGQIKSAENRKRIFDMLKKLNYELPVIISPRAYVSKHAFVDEGTVIMHDVIINAGAKIGKNCIINTKALIEHDAIIKDHCHIATGAIINGSCKIENEVFIGSNTVLANNVSIVSNTIIGAGSVINKDIEDFGTYVGNPIRRIRE